ncbi:C2H2 finger domain-containing protein [Histoplasma capsulatum]|uniref:C2H2 finger domain-containing protein n=1 Tax=Ajellomyces capsulatus TaxID=5037 RepID=A0A8A1MHV6_AJECA|nr:C2H2 finger domain-containing protein [Histoplasma capsulatum]
MADVDSLAQNRRRGRDEGRDASHAGHDQHDSGEPSHSQSDSIKKRKRTRKGDSEKKFECKHEGCGKSYSRAEHLYRHQLNHCYRSFVRQDLCVRHRERHTTHGSQLQKRDNFTHTANTLAAVAPQVRNAFPTGNGTNITCSPTDDSISPYPKQIPSENASGNMSRPRLPASSSAPNGGPTNGQNYSHSSAVRSAGSSSSTSIENHLQLLTPQQQYAVPNPRLKRSDSSSSYTLSPQKQSTSIGLNALDPSPGVMVPGSSVSDWDALSSYSLPIFGGETLNRSPFAMTDDFTAWLFNEHSNNNSPIAYPNAPGMVPNYADQASAQLQGPYYPSDAALTSYFTNVVQPQHPMSVTSLLDSGPPQSIMSDEKRNELLELIQSRFNETNQAAMKTRKDALLDGDIDDDGHLLSLRMMQTYIAAYWYHTHDQLPILHKPTFSADKTPNLLLLAIMAIGASTLDKNHGHHVTEAASELANFLAWHIRHLQSSGCSRRCYSSKFARSCIQHGLCTNVLISITIPH